MKHRLLLIFLLCLLVVPGLAYGQATINVESKATHPGGTATIDVTVSAVPEPGAALIDGTFSFNPVGVVDVENIEVEGLNDFTVLFTTIDPILGTVRVVAMIFPASGSPGVTDGGILRLRVQAIGTAGDSCAIEFEVADFGNLDGIAIPHTVVPGTFTISSQIPPTADFSYWPPNPTINDSIQFTDLSTDPDGVIVAWDWTFGDGTTSDLKNPTHQYTNGGDYTVTLTVTDNDGATDPRSQTVTVAGPSAAFTYTPGNPTTQDPVSFLDQSTDPTGNIVSWSWVFGDGEVSGDQNPTHTFATPGTYQVTLTIESSSGATVSTSHSVVVLNAPPIADFTFNPQAPNVGDMVTFSAGRSSDPDGHIILYEWDFESDGTYEISGASASTVTHTFTVTGSHNVTLRVTDNTGDQRTKTKPVPVGGIATGPTAAFTYNPDPASIGQAISFNGSSSSAPGGIITLYEWDFDDVAGAVDATGVNVVHTFAAAGPHNVKLTVTDSNGKQGTITKVIPVAKNPPIAVFTISDATPKVGDVVTFDASNSSDPPNGRIIAYQWDFDDDGVAGDIDATGVTVNHSFPTAGTHKVTLTVTDNDGNVTTDTQWLNVESARPTAAFTFTPANPNAGRVVSFDASTSTDADGTIILYEWNFGDGSPAATGLAVTHAFPTPGVYPVRLKVTDNDTEFDVTTQGVPVEMGGTGGVNRPPVADFTFEPATGRDVNLNEVVTFKADGCSDADGTVEAYEWDLNGNGVYDATGTTVTHIYNTGGSKIVTLRVTDNEGARGFKTRVVPVEFIRPTADFTFTPANPKVGNVVTFDGSTSSDGDGRVDFYEWDFDNDGIVDATGMSVAHVFSTGGSRAVTLKVTDNDGVTGYTTKSVPVRINNPPTADFTISPATPTTADTITFEDASTDPDPDDSVVTWQWEFGDGTTSDVQAPSHKYTTAKTYSVKLTVTDKDGATSSITKDITVGEPANVLPVANFSFTPTGPQVNQAVQFTDLSTDADGTVTGWDWDFGDGGTSTDKNPTHQYTTEGTYTVSLIATDNDGATSTTTTKQITVVQGVTMLILHTYPNPASVRAIVSYQYPTGTTDAELRVFNITGALIFSASLLTTANEYEWNLNSTGGDPQPNGLYFCVITAKDASGKTIKSAIFKLLIKR